MRHPFLARVMRAAALLGPFLLAGLPVSNTFAQDSGRPDGLRFIPNVHEQFASLTERPEALGFHIDGTPDPSFCKHYQAIVRVAAPDGTPYFLLTRSGNTPGTFGAGTVCDDTDGERGWGNLVVVRMGSRDKNGERLRSNRLKRFVHMDDTVAPAEDAATNFFTFTANGIVPGHGGSPRPQELYQHPGGMQVIGHVLAVAMDTRANANDEPDTDLYPKSMIQFYDVSNPEAPSLLSKFSPRDRFGNQLNDADGLAVTALPGGYYLMVVIGGFPADEGDHGTFRFYRSTLHNDEHNPNVLLRPDLSWQLVREVGPPNTEDAHQQLHFFREGSIDGELYLAGSRGHPVYSDHDRIDLYRVSSTTRDFDPDNLSGQLIGLIPEISSRRLLMLQASGGSPKADLAAAAGFYESPSGELILYATKHENDEDRNTVSAAEWRNVDVVRPGSPTYLPTARVDGPFVVDEGGSVRLTGAGSPPITKAWIELFNSREYGGPHYESYFPMVDYDDYDKDNFDNLNAFEYQHFIIEDDFYFADKAQSMKWFAPTGCSIHLTDYVGTAVDEDKTLVGDGAPHGSPDLRLVQNDGGGDDIDQELDAVDFLPGCDDYYAGPFDLVWDLNLDGSFETAGNEATFSAASFDGPSELDVPARAVDRLGGTPGEVRTTHVSVRNVAPRIESTMLLDPFGNELGSEISAGLALTLAGVFTDAGALDTHSATLDWGDGTVVNAFDSFTDATGGGRGRLTQQHRYAAGSYTLALTVRDDDGGTVRITRNVVAKPADLALAMQGPADVNVKIGGEVELRYVLTVTNKGPGAAGGIAVSDALPAGTLFASAGIAGGTCQTPAVGAGGAVTCSVATLSSGASTTMSLVIRKKPGVLGITTVTNAASVASASTDPVATNNAASVRSTVIAVLNR